MAEASTPDVEADVLVVGGGMVGLALAVALASAGVKVCVVDRAAPQTVLAPAFDGRASAIAYASRAMLEAIGVWAEVAESQPILDIRVSDRESALYAHYDHRRLGGEPFGAMVENRHLRLALHRSANRTGVRFFAPQSVKALERTDFSTRARLDDGTQITAPLAVAADGARSQIRAMAGIGVRGWRYRQTGIVTTVGHARPHRGIAHERFLHGGPFAILPLTGNRSSLVWTEPTDLAPAIMALPPARFAEELGARFGDFLGPLAVARGRWSYPLSLAQADRYVSHRLALIGDAAHVMHPIAGQGLNLGLRDAAAIAEVIVDARRLGLDPGGASALARYERWRRVDALTLLTVTDGLNRLFSTDFRPAALARDIGLAVVNRLEPVKRLLVNHARGTVGKLPRLLSGAPL